MKSKKYMKRILWILLTCFVLLNVVAFFHAYKFTHYTLAPVTKTKHVSDMSVADKLKTLLFGINNPRPVNHRTPTQPFETVTLQSNKTIECWSIKADSSKGTVILFHGYTGNKATMLDKSDEFLKLGYSTFIVDFMGSGGSEGNETTVGFKEAEEVKTCYDYFVQKDERNIFLFGSSMGAAAILKAMRDYDLKPKGIILECPFGTMYETTCARFRTLNAPPFPMAAVLLFWGGVQNGFWPFSHNPEEYAKSVKCSTLLLWGEQDEKVSRHETETIFANLAGFKELRIFPLAGHDNYLKIYKEQWVKYMDDFLNGERDQRR